MDSNVTIRNKKTSVRHETSYESLPCINNSSLLSEDSNLMRSLPDLSTIQNDETIMELKSTINHMKLKIESADNEIDRLILENKLLKQTISDQDIKIKELIKICSSSSKTSLTKPSGKKIKQRRINFTPVGLNKSLFSDNYENQSPILLPNKLVPEKCLTPSTSGLQNLVSKNQKSGVSQNELKAKLTNTNADIPTSPEHTTDSKSPPIEITSIKPNITCKKRQIIIFGTQQCRGLVSKLLNSRVNTKYEQYSVSSITKPYAKCDEVLRGCESAMTSEKDKIVLCIGENDTNPTILLSELYYFLKLFKTNSVFLLDVKKIAFSINVC